MIMCITCVQELGIAVLSLHGSMSVEKRDAVVKDITSDRVKVLVTSVMLTLLRDSLQCHQVIYTIQGSSNIHFYVGYHF